MTPEERKQAQAEIIRSMQRDTMGGMSHEDYYQAWLARMAERGFWFHA